MAGDYSDYTIRFMIDVAEAVAGLQSVRVASKDTEKDLVAAQKRFKTLSQTAQSGLKVIQAGFGDTDAAAEVLQFEIKEVSNEIIRLVSEGKKLSEAEGVVRNINVAFKSFSAQGMKQGIAQAKDELEKMRKASIDTFQLGRTESKKFRQNVDEIKESFKQAGITSKQALKDMEQGLRNANAQSEKFTGREISTAVSEFGKRIEDATESVHRFGSVGEWAFGTVLGISAVAAIRKVIDSLRELVDVGIEVSRSLFRLTTAVHALQRVGTEITFAEVIEQIETLREKFGLFTTQELAGGIAQIQLLTRNAQLSKEEMFELSNAIAELSVLTGKDFVTAATDIARAISSGYTESLQRAGIQVARLTVEDEAFRQGIEKTFLALSEQERAAITLDLILKQIAAQSEDVALWQNTAGGRIEAANTELREQGQVLSQFVTPVWAKFLEILVSIVKWVVDVTRAFLDFSITLMGPVYGSVLGLIAIFFALRDGVKLSMEDVVRIVKDAAQQTTEALRESIVGKFDIQFLGEDLPEDQFGQFPLPEPLDESADKRQNILDKVTKIFTDWANGIRDINTDLTRKLEDIEIKRLQKIFDANTKAQQDREKIDRQFADKRADAEEKYREQEIKAEEDFQDRLLSLREKFLFDLEDALRERDAKQVLRLIRRFNLEQNELDRNNDREREQRRRNFENELKDIEQQKQRRLRELEIELSQRLDLIDLQAEREREAAKRNFAREFQDLRQRRDDRLKAIRDGLDAELQLYFDYVVKRIGILTRLAQEEKKLQQLMMLTGMLGLSGRSSEGYGSTRKREGTDKGQYQLLPYREPQPGDLSGFGFREGGTLVATKPTVAMFGEIPEVVTFTPLNRVGANEGRVFGGTLPAGLGARDQIDLLVTLSPGLEADIVDRTMGGLANIIVEQT